MRRIYTQGIRIKHVFAWKSFSIHFFNLNMCKISKIIHQVNEVYKFYSNNEHLSIFYNLKKG